MCPKTPDAKFSQQISIVYVAVFCWCWVFVGPRPGLNPNGSESIIARQNQNKRPISFLSPSSLSTSLARHFLARRTKKERTSKP